MLRISTSGMHFPAKVTEAGTGWVSRGWERIKEKSTQMPHLDCTGTSKQDLNRVRVAESCRGSHSSLHLLVCEGKIVTSTQTVSKLFREQRVNDQSDCAEDSEAEAKPSQKEGYGHLAMSAKMGGHPLLAIYHFHPK